MQQDEMKMIAVLLGLALAFAVPNALAQVSVGPGSLTEGGYVPPKGFVPDAKTAITIARAVLIPIFGEGTIRDEEPLTAKRQGNIWVVSGTLHCAIANTCDGGVAFLALSAKDGRILKVTHGK